MKKETSHVFLPEYECAEGLNSVVDEFSLLLDIKALLNEYYLATFSENGNSLDIAFNNGQKFRLTVKEISSD